MGPVRYGANPGSCVDTRDEKHNASASAALAAAAAAMSVVSDPSDVGATEDNLSPPFIEELDLEELGPVGEGQQPGTSPSKRLWSGLQSSAASRSNSGKGVLDVFGRALEDDLDRLFASDTTTTTPSDTLVPAPPAKRPRTDGFGGLTFPSHASTPFSSIDGLQSTLLNGTTTTGLTPQFDIFAPGATTSTTAPALLDRDCSMDGFLTRELARELALTAEVPTASDSNPDTDDSDDSNPTSPPSTNTDENTTKPKTQSGSSRRRRSTQGRTTSKKPRATRGRARKVKQENIDNVIVPYDSVTAKEATLAAAAATAIDPYDPDLDDPDIDIKAATKDLEWVGPSGAFEFKDWEQEARRKATKSPPRSMKSITDEQLAFTDLNVLLGLMRKENYTTAQIEEAKRLRRKCKNRLSAKGSASKRRVQMSSIAAVNKKLVQCVTGLKKRNADLVDSNLELKKSVAVATDEANRAREGKLRFQAEINRLTELVSTMAANQQRGQGQNTLHQQVPAVLPTSLHFQQTV